MFEERLCLELNLAEEELQKSLEQEEEKEFNFYKVQLGKHDLDKFKPKAMKEEFQVQLVLFQPSKK